MIAPSSRSGIPRLASSWAMPCGPVTSSKKRRCSSARAGPSDTPALRGPGARARALRVGPCLGGHGLGAKRLLDDAPERRQLVVPLDEGGHGAEARDGVAIELPHLVAHGLVVRVGPDRAHAA